MRDRSSVRFSRRRRRWASVSWWFSLLFVAGLLAWAVTYVVDIRDGDSSTSAAMMVTVIDAGSSMPLAGAEVRMGDQIVVTDASGTAFLPMPGDRQLITVGLDGFISVYGEAGPGSAAEQVVPLTAQASGGGSTTEAALPQDGESGQPLVNDLPFREESSGTPAPALAIGSLRLQDPQGAPIITASVLADGTVYRPDASGVVSPLSVPAATEVIVQAPGYRKVTVSLPASGMIEVTMERQDIKAAFLTGAYLSNEDKITELMDLIDRTELNALVIDIKEGTVYYDTQVQFFHDADAVYPVFDPASLVRRLHERGIYAIARMVVFNDPLVAEAMPELSVRDSSGDLWRGWNGGAWVNPFNRSLWQPNIDLALEAARMGFDEIQYDYIRFPSDGDLSTAEFGPNYTEEGRVQAIVDFLEVSRDAIAAEGAMLAVDVFGIVAVFPDDQGIGQRLSDFAEVVDYVCPMLYPSHFDTGFMGLEGEPNDLPYETLDLSVSLGMQKIPGLELKMRPWLQDFSWGDRVYGAAEVRSQIDATMIHGASGWMLWNPDNDFTEGALEGSELVLAVDPPEPNS